MRWFHRLQLVAATLPFLASAGLGNARAQATATIPVLAPLTGFLALEGASQRNGALLAFAHHPQVTIRTETVDTATSPEAAVNAFARSLRLAPLTAMVAPMLGTQMLALLPAAAEAGVPLVTISGTAEITERDNAWVFRFFPGDAVVKTAQARYAVEELGRRRVALVYQTTAYGQSGRRHLAAEFERLGAAIVFEDGLSPAVKDMAPVVTRLRAARPDVLVLQLHAESTARIIRQAAALGLGLPVVAGSAMHQPATAALLEPAELAGVCAESGSSPISGGSPAMEQWVADYRARFQSEPDAFALAQYDGVSMVLRAVLAGAQGGEAIRQRLATGRHEGLAMAYRSDGRGNMAHDAVILCYDGKDRVPRITRRYVDVLKNG
ncbi:amino acid/amide ABC transporter substrate-binding protein (HAAT family) [Stella humosa]|uniref:Amino acid/amide ABC transporter substrate-binding protein (HAAT family) n=1 Tax=Stella humosa TaxID=94 RepID=A0A3N1KWK9_9PROT|nr:ABC transporter substrate-binding protein [Stella humosa]ROP83199.1 amino acid/amide ABC transporter substrate-binding protein (HAAT family) [Stella humosa]BBK30022.1 ethanolamine utilization protein EutJ [Stella humosa]